MRNIFIKQGPTVFLKNVIIMEFIATFLFFLASFLGNYEMFYRGLGLIDYLRYDIFLMLAVSLFQLTYLTILFLNWYFSYFEIKEKEIIKKTGIFLRRKQSLYLSKISSVETRQSILDRLINHGTIILEKNGGGYFKIKNVPNYEEYSDEIKRLVQNTGNKPRVRNLREMISLGESSSLEFKESLRFDKKTNTINKDLEKSIVKSIIGFLNTDGGSLLIGVSDEGFIKGLREDYNSLQKKNRDGFENHLMLLIKSMIGIQFIRFIEISFQSLHSDEKDKEICIVDVKNSSKPVYFKNNDKEEFFIRTKNSTQPLSMSETEEYIKNHFKN